MVEDTRQVVGRSEAGYREVAERLRDFDEVECSLTDDQIIDQASRCMDCGTPFCHGYACPLANIIPETNQLVASGRWKEALKLLLSTHPFPEFTARICPALCEGSCVLGINEEAVSIRQIEKAIIEKGFEKGWIKPRPPRSRRPEKVAIIGSGPCGLAAAEILNQNGYEVTVYDKELSPGGLLMYGIPNFKLNKQVILRRINLMKDEGVIFERGIAVGTDISFNYLKRHFAAVLLAGGAEEPRDLDLPGRDLKGIHFALDLLKAQNKNILSEPLAEGEAITAKGKNVLVIGGGDTGSDCIGTALRQGAKAVHQVEIMPQAPEKRSAGNPWPLWPIIDRVSSSHREGGTRRWCIDTIKFCGNEQHEVTKAQCCEVEWVEKEGRFVSQRIDNSDFTIDADLVLLALGFTGPGPNPLADAIGLVRDERGNLLVDERHRTSMEGVFSAGDMARGQSLVVRAMADGVKAAADIDSYCRNKG
jgi:glutamate synthase (NADPH) small chain